MTLYSSQSNELSVFISEDLMSARILIEKKSILDVVALRTALQNNGVIHGIDDQKLASGLEKLIQRGPPVVIEYAAKGTPPQDSRFGALEIKVKCLNSRNQAEVVAEAANYWDVREIASTAEPVPKYGVIAEQSIASAPKPGVNVLGEPVFSDQKPLLDLIIGNGARYSSDGTQVVAEFDGIPYFYNNILGVTALNLGGKLDLLLSDDRMSADLVVYPPLIETSPISIEAVKEILKLKNIRFGLDVPLIESLFTQFKENRFPSEKICIARGKPPIAGNDGSIEYHFQVLTSLKPQENPDGSVDYKNVDIIHPVSKGNSLARLIPPGAGIDGSDIHGNSIPALKGKNIALPVGENTVINPLDPLELLSLIDGLVKFNGRTIEVTEGYIIKGDVDFSTGNVNYNKTVVVEGDIKSGFEIECGGDLQVNGTIEDSQLHIGGNVLCKHGFVGQGKGTIEGRGDINISFVKNQTIKGYKNINIARETINSTIQARKSICVHGNPLSVAGGSLVAREFIIVNTVGNASGIRTTLEVGYDFVLGEEIVKMNYAILEMNENLKKLKENQLSMQQKIQRNKGNDKDKILLDKLSTALLQYSKQLDSLENKRKLVTSKLYTTDNVFIKINYAAHPGTVIKIGERHLLVKEEIVGPKKIVIVRHEIRVL